MNRSEATPERAHAPESPNSPPHGGRRVLVLVAPLLPVLLALAAWYFGDLGSFTSPERVADAARTLRESPLGIVYVLCAFAVGTLLFFPITALVLGTTLAFDPLRGFSYAVAGTLLGSTITYYLGRLVGSRALDYVSGPKLRRFGEELRHHAFRASIVARILPVGNFTAINLLAGSLRIPFRAFFFGNLVGIMPGTIALTFFSKQIGAALRSPSKENIMYVAGGAALLGLMAWLVRRASTRRAKSPAGEEASP